VNQWWKPRNGEAGSNLADLGRSAAHDDEGIVHVVDSEAG
jgi:hypothetical protein